MKITPGTNYAVNTDRLPNPQPGVTPLSLVTVTEIASNGDVRGTNMGARVRYDRNLVVSTWAEHEAARGLGHTGAPICAACNGPAPRP